MFGQVTYVCAEYSNFQGSKSIYMISDFTVFLSILLKQLNYAVYVVSLFGILRLLQKKDPLFFNL